MEIVIENPTESQNMIKSNVNTGYGGYQNASGHRPYYSTLPPRRTQPHIQKQLDFDPTVSSVRRVDKSGLLEISETDLPRRTRHLTGAESLSGTLTRRIDRTGLLEAVPEVPDQLQVQRSPQCSPTITERHLTGAENDHKDQKHIVMSPRITQSSDSTRQADNIIALNSPKVSSPYFRRQISPNPVDNNDIISGVDKNISPIDSQRSNNRQSYVDLTGATYTKARNNSPLMITRGNTTIDGSNNDDDTKQTPDCLSRLSPRLKSDGQSPMTVPCIPDVIEAHGSKKCDDDGKVTPEGERAEAEGCEHTAIESLEETRVSFKAPNKILHNDNIQTLRVIILSEQL